MLVSMTVTTHDDFSFCVFVIVFVLYYVIRHIVNFAALLQYNLYNNIKK